MKNKNCPWKVQNCPYETPFYLGRDFFFSFVLCEFFAKGFFFLNLIYLTSKNFFPLKELMQILPNDCGDFKFVLFPLQVGFCRRPSFHVKLTNYNWTSSDKSKTDAIESANTSDNSIIDSVIQSMLPTQLFIFPEKNVDAIFKEPSHLRE